MTWSVILDPHAIAGSAPANRTELNLNSGPIMIDQKGIEWGDSQIQTYLADRRVGSIKIDFRMPNRKVTIPLFLMDDPSGVGLTEEQARAELQQKVGLFQMSGGWLMRQRAGGPPTYADVIDAVLTLPDVWGETGAVEPNINLILECSPDFYGDEIALDVGSSADGVLTGPLQSLGANAVLGGNHLGRASVLVTDTSGADQESLVWGFRATYYSSVATAELRYYANDLDPVSPAAVAVVSGRSGVQHTTLTPSVWSPILNTDIPGVGPLTHLGSYRVRARVLTTSTTNVWLRLAWGVGPAIGVTTNDMVLIPAPSSFFIIDLGEIRVDFPPIGTLRWQGQIQGLGGTGGENAFIDQIYLQPLDDAAGYATASPSVPSLPTLVSPVARDAFNQAGGNLSGKAPDLPLATTWSVPVAGAGDFIVDGVNHVLTRAVVDAAAHYAVVGPSMTDVTVSADIGFSAITTGTYAGLLIRYQNTTNWFGAAIYCQTPSSYPGGKSMPPMRIYFMKAIGGAAVLAYSSAFQTPPVLPAVTNFTVVVSSTGIVRAFLDGYAYGLFNDSDLATGGALDHGQAGIWEQAAPNALTRQYDNFIAYPTAGNDAVCFGHASADLRYDGMFRADATNTYFGPMANVVGDLPRVPPSGIENRPVELFLLVSKGDLGNQADLVPSSFTAQLRYRPVYIHRA